MEIIKYYVFLLKAHFVFTLRILDTFNQLMYVILSQAHRWISTLLPTEYQHRST